ncbi:hypothetical protein KA047_00090 [Candidatus Saccharibacteria bacterium]|nr:hypothetical protein [Candidatus Saccharibacteria bacterium]
MNLQQGLSLSAEDYGEVMPPHYYEDKIAIIRAGAVTWMRRNFDSDAGLVIDLVDQREHYGFVLAEHDHPYARAAGFTAVAYLMNDSREAELLDAESESAPTAIPAAAFLLVQHLVRTGRIEESRAN